MALKVQFQQDYLKWKANDIALLDNTQALQLHTKGIAQILNKPISKPKITVRSTCCGKWLKQKRL